METTREQGSTTTAEPEGQPEWVTRPQEEHDWLQQLVGEWTYESEAPMEPDQPAMKATGTETVRSLGGLWTVAEGRGEMPGNGGEATTVMTLGYDPASKRFMGTFIASMMATLWVYEGQLDASRKELALDTEGPSMKGDGKTAKYREVIRIESDGHRTFTSHRLEDDGSRVLMMTASYRRRG